MNNEQLERLLRDAAGGDMTPDVSGDLAGRVRRRLVRRQKQHRFIASSTGILLLVAAVGIWHVADQTRRVGTAQQDPAQSKTSRVGIAHQNPGPALRYGPGTQISPGTSRNGADTQPKVPGAPLHSAPATQDAPDTVALQAEVKRLQAEIAQLRAQIKESEDRQRFQKQLAALRRELRKPSPQDLAMAEIEKTAFLLVHRAKACEAQNRSDEARQEYEQVVRLFPNTSSAKVAQAILAKNFPPKGIKQ